MDKQFLSTIADQVGELLNKTAYRDRFRENLERFNQQMDNYHAEMLNCGISDDEELDNDFTLGQPHSPLSLELHGPDKLPSCYAWLTLIHDTMRNRSISEPMKRIIDHRTVTVMEYLIENNNGLTDSTDTIKGALAEVRFDLQSRGEDDWENPAYITNKEAISMADNRLSYATLNKLLRSGKSDIRYIKKGNRCKVHIEDWRRFINTLGPDKFTEAAFNSYFGQAEKTKELIKSKKMK